MSRFLTGFLALCVTLAVGVEAAHAERWLRVMAKDPNKGGKYAWFDVDTIVYEPKGGLILVRSTVATPKAVAGGGMSHWRLWGIDCKAQKAFRVGAADKGAYKQEVNWQTDPKLSVSLAGKPTDRVVAALGGKVCAWSDSWPSGTMPAG
ncbi:MAG TPA: hypothetical protein VFB16_02975 [Bauldia sp.]|nr:hypothetical protein [Bauldia sp.]